MNSLKTYDIDGAKPKIRHPQRVYFYQRQQQTLPYNHPHYNNNPQPSKYISEINMSQSRHYNQTPKYQHNHKSKQQNQIQLQSRVISQQIILPIKNQIHSFPNQKNTSMEMLEKRPQMSSRNRGQSVSINRQNQKNIFRGLGFNIITNNTFTYDYEKTMLKPNLNKP